MRNRNPKNVKIGDTTLDVLLKLYDEFLNDEERYNDDGQVNEKYKDLPLIGIIPPKINSVQRLDLSGADLHNVDMRGANLKYVCLNKANLSGANLYNANLDSADLTMADIINTNLNEANMDGAYLTCAFIRSSSLRNANLTETKFDCAMLFDVKFCKSDLHLSSFRCASIDDCNFNEASLEDACLDCCSIFSSSFIQTDMTGVFIDNIAGFYPRYKDIFDRAKNVYHVPVECPTHGSFIGWKKIAKDKNGKTTEYLVKLEIPEDAKRTSIKYGKCKCSKAMVLGIYNLDGTAVKFKSIINNSFGVKTTRYTIGKMVYPDSYDDIRYTCSNGIYFFADREVALNYKL